MSSGINTSKVTPAKLINRLYIEINYENVPTARYHLLESERIGGTRGVCVDLVSLHTHITPPQFSIISLIPAHCA